MKNLLDMLSGRLGNAQESVNLKAGKWKLFKFQKRERREEI